MPNILSLLALCLLFAVVGGRSLYLARHGVKAFVFARTDKSDYLLLPIVALFIYSVAAYALSWPLPQSLAGLWCSSKVLFWLGLSLCLLAAAGVLAAVLSFGRSFRVGIDDRQPGALITGGLFAFSRNPIYLCFLSFFGGMLLQYPSTLMLLLLGLITAALHRQVLREEAFLRVHYGAPYAAYCRRVRRYLGRRAAR